MSYNTPDTLKTILEIPAGVTDATLQAFLDDAFLIVSEGLSATLLSTARLTMIEKYLACHLTTMLTERGGLKSSRIGQSRDDYNTPDAVLQGFMSSRWGQLAIQADTTGTLKAMSSPKLSALFNVIGNRLCGYYSGPASLGGPCG